MASSDTLPSSADPPQSPFFRSLNADRYARQSMITAYEARHGCRLAVMAGPIIDDSIVLFQDLIYDANPQEDIHLLLASPGGDGEVAVRLARQSSLSAENLRSSCLIRPKAPPLCSPWERIIS